MNPGGRAPIRRILPPIAALLAISVAGCAHRPGSPAQEGFRFSDASQPGAGGLRLLSRTTVFHARGRRSFRQLIALEPPDRLRLEVLGPFGDPRLVLAIRDGEAVGILPGDRLYFLEPDSREVFRFLLGVALGAEAVVGMLTGEVLPRDAGTRLGPAHPEPPGWRLEAWRESTGVRYDLLVDGRSGRIVEADLYGPGDPGGPVLEVRYSGPGRRRGLPVRIEWSVPAAAIRVVQHLEIRGGNRDPLPEDLFRPTVPPGFRKVGIEDLGEEVPWLATGD